MSVKIELGFTQAGIGAPFITLGDAEKGIIGSEDFFIGGGEVFVDISEYLQSLQITRGKGRELEKFNSGTLSAVFTNNERFFDPTYEASPFFGQIVPKRAVRVSVDDVVEYTGAVDDWQIDYEPSGISVASLVASDAFATLANNTFTSFSPGSQLSGARINSALDNIDWPASLRNIDAGEETLHSTTSATGDDALAYMHRVEQSELGFLFIDKLGRVRFISRNGSFGASVITFSDDGTDVPYTNIQASFGSEFLYNRITLTSDAGSATRNDAFSQAIYGLSDYAEDTFNINLTRLGLIADALLTKYKEPEFRFQNLTISLDALSPENRAALLLVELGDVVQVKFTPSQIPPTITRVARVTGIQQAIDTSQNILTLQLSSIDGSPLVIGSLEFGRIGEGTLGF